MVHIVRQLIPKLLPLIMKHAMVYELDEYITCTLMISINLQNDVNVNDSNTFGTPKYVDLTYSISRNNSLYHDQLNLKIIDEKKFWNRVGSLVLKCMHHYIVSHIYEFHEYDQVLEDDVEAVEAIDIPSVIMQIKCEIESEWLVLTIDTGFNLAWNHQNDIPNHLYRYLTTFHNTHITSSLDNEFTVE